MVLKKIIFLLFLLFSCVDYNTENLINNRNQKITNSFDDKLTGKWKLFSITYRVKSNSPIYIYNDSCFKTNNSLFSESDVFLYFKDDSCSINNSKPILYERLLQTIFFHVDKNIKYPFINDRVDIVKIDSNRLFLIENIYNNSFSKIGYIKYNFIKL